MGIISSYLPRFSLFFSFILALALVNSVSAAEYSQIGEGSSPDVDINPNISAPDIEVPNVSAPEVNLPGSNSSESDSNSISQPVQGNKNNTIMAVIDGDTVLKDAVWTEDGVNLFIQNDRPKVATVTDVNSMATTGASQVNFKRVTLGSGMNEIFISPTNKRGSRTVNISAGEGMVAVSSPDQPIIESVGRLDFYTFGALTSVMAVIQVLLRKMFMKYRLKRGLIRVN